MNNNQKSRELLPCPFCGKRASIRRHGKGYRVMCNACGAMGARAQIQLSHDTKMVAQDEAKIKWNTRIF